MAEMRRRFSQEARLAASLDHPRICLLHDVGEDAGMRYLVMEFLEGETLASRLTRGPLPMHELLDTPSRLHRRLCTPTAVASFIAI